MLEACALTRYDASQMSHADRPIRTIQSLDRATAILRALAASPEGMTLTNLAAYLKLAPQTLQSLIRTLQVHGFVVQDQKGTPYRLGPGVLALAQQFIASDGLSAAARPAIAALAASTGEYVLLAELHGFALTAMVEARPHQPLMVERLRFATDQLHAMATGKLLLAFLEPEARAQMLSRLNLVPLARNTVTDPRGFGAQLVEIKRSEQAVCIDERADHVVALAVPVRDASRTVRAALGISLPTARYSVTKGKSLLKEMRRTAQEIANAWGLAN